ncbi:MAG: ABC transporter permease subunit, partial [Actinobacteria bacterium]
LLPWAAPLPLSLMGWTWIFDTTYSIINWTLQHLHLASTVSPPQWLAQPRLAMGSVIAVHAWRIIPFATVIFLAGLASIPKEVDDAAAIDGATGFRKFWSVSLPLQLPIATVALLFGIVFTATDMAVVYILTNVPLTRTRRGCDRDADLRAPRGGDVAMDAVLRGFREKGLSYLIVGPFAIVLAFPFYVMVITAFKQQRDFYDLSHTPYWFHKGPTLSNARFLFDETQYTTWLRNTAIVGVVVVLITLVLAVPAGYALARLSGKLGQSVGVGIFLTYLVPPTLLFLPLFSVITQLDRQTSSLLHFHLRGSIWSLVLVYPSFTVPFATWLLMGFFKTIPRELEDAALIDGASRLGTLVRIVFPISVPGILTVVIFSFSLVVNEFVYAFTFISASAHRTLSTGVYTDLIRGDLPQWGAIMVASLIPSIPLALLYNTFLDRFIAGFTGGAFR